MLIHGIVISRNDWGNLAVAISHALTNHVDKVHVLNHGSVDRTANGLTVLQKLWGQRLSVYTAPSDLPFDQGLLTNMMAFIAENDGADWIYVFDSDEILITKEKDGLKNELKKIPSEFVCLRYQISNYISFYDFNREKLSNYLDLTFESLPNKNAAFEESWESIYSNGTTFFNYSFGSKIIYRANKNLMISAGGHKLVGSVNGDLEARSISLVCAHLPYICREILDRKAILGKGKIDNGYPIWHGWQNQLVYKIKNEGWLDEFWQRHSINKDQPSKSTKAIYHKNHILRDSLEITINNLKNFFGDDDLSHYKKVEIKKGISEQSNLTFRELVGLCSQYSNRINILNKDNLMLTSPKNSFLNKIKSAFNDRINVGKK